MEVWEYQRPDFVCFFFVEASPQDVYLGDWGPRAHGMILLTNTNTMLGRHGLDPLERFADHVGISVCMGGGGGGGRLSLCLCVSVSASISVSCIYICFPTAAQRPVPHS